MADQTDILKNHTPLDPDRMYADLEEKLNRCGGHCGRHGA